MEKVIRTEEGGRRSRELIRVWRESYWPSKQMAERDLVAVRANGGERDMEKAIRRRRRRSRGERDKTKHCFSFLLTFIYFLFLLIIFYPNFFIYFLPCHRWYGGGGCMALVCTCIFFLIYIRPLALTNLYCFKCQQLSIEHLLDWTIETCGVSSVPRPLYNSQSNWTLVCFQETA